VIFRVKREQSHGTVCFLLFLREKVPYSIIIAIILSFSASFNVSAEQGKMMPIRQWQILPVLEYPVQAVGSSFMTIKSLPLPLWQETHLDGPVRLEYLPDAKFFSRFFCPAIAGIF
jgi:hypothetical protein